MSSITSTAGGLSQLLQSITGNTSSTSSSAPVATTSTPSATTQKTSRHGGHGHAFEKLADAVTNALQQAGTSTSTDPNQTVTEALEKIFKNGSLTANGQGDADASSTPASNSASPATTGSIASTLPDDFAKTLQSFGITPQQFQTDFTNALKSAQQTGTVDVSSAFKNFPVGSVVDAVG